MLALVEDGRVEHLGEEPLVLGSSSCKPRDDVTADHHMDVREGLLDHLAEGQARQQLHLRADGDADHVRLLFATAGMTS